ncbi:MAG: prfA, partial [Hyphomicrobiales bacterium]|nr:prfA [Hyphomicrobiales bacterium]
MATLPQDKLEGLERRLEAVEAELSAGPSAEAYVRLSKEHADLLPVVGPIQAYRRALADFASAEELARGGDSEMREMAEV